MAGVVELRPGDSCATEFKRDNTGCHQNGHGCPDLSSVGATRPPHDPTISELEVIWPELADVR